MKKLKTILSLIMLTTFIVSCGDGNQKKENQEDSEEATEVFDGDITGYYSYEKNGEIAYKIEKGYVDNEGFQTYICTTYIKGKAIGEKKGKYGIYDRFQVYKSSSSTFKGYAKRNYGDDFDKWILNSLNVEDKTQLIWVKKGKRIQIDRSIWRKNGFDYEDIDFKAKTGVVLWDSNLKWHNMYKVKDIEDKKEVK